MIHKRFGSSTAARTDECQQWVAESEGVPRQESEAAVDGTIVHGVLEAMGLGDSALPTTVEGHPVTDDHVELADAMWLTARQVMAAHGIMDYEPEVTATTAEDVGGTLDLVGWTETADVWMFLDYKAGAGVQVDAENNKQILFAAANVLYGDSVLEADVKKAAPEDFVGVIIQPGRDGNIYAKSWKFTIEEVDKFWARHQENIARARAGEGSLHAGDHCKFCPANGLCDATTGNLLRMATLDPDDIEQLVWALDHVEAVKTTIKAVEKLAYDQLELGVEIPGWKLVRGRAGNTTWIDPDTAAKKLKRAARGKRTADGTRLGALLEPKKLVTPTQAEKILKQHALDMPADLTYRPEAKSNTLARADDPREAVLSTQALADGLASVRR